jgi:hypothetical protein
MAQSSSFAETVYREEHERTIERVIFTEEADEKIIFLENRDGSPKLIN